MTSFKIALTNVLITLLFVLPGFILGKTKKASTEHLSTMSAVLIYVLSPCMIVSSFLQLDFSLENLGRMGIFFAITLVLQSAFMLALFLIFRKKYNDSKYRILTIGSVLGNVGFFGQPIIRALLPDFPEALCYSSVYVVSMNILVFSVGVFCLTNDKKFMSVKSMLLNPSTLGLAVGLPLYILGAKQYIPEVLSDAINLLGRATTPLCMIILGVRLSSVSFKKLFTRPVIYAACLLKLLVFPLFGFLCVYFLPLDFSFKASVLILSATPCASVILNMAEIHGSETELAANCVLLSTLSCFATIPLLALLI